eukprot:s2183_g14.t1
MPTLTFFVPGLECLTCPSQSVIEIVDGSDIGAIAVIVMAESSKTITHCCFPNQLSQRCAAWQLLVCRPADWEDENPEGINLQYADELIWRMSVLALSGREGMSVAQISKVLRFEEAAVVWSLARGGLGEEDEDHGTFPAGFSCDAVRDLLKDRSELLCPISLELMEDPVIAADGYTYERLPQSLLGWDDLQVLFPNRDKKSAIVQYKESVVQGVFSLKEQLLSSDTIDQALKLKLLEKAELFVRPLLPDTSARKQLAALLLIRVKLISSNRDSVILEICVLLLDFGDEKLTLEFLCDVSEQEVARVLEELEDEMFSRLRETQTFQLSPVHPHRDAFDLEYTRRLARHAGDDGQLKELWELLLLHDQKDSWLKATAVVLASFVDRLDVDLTTLGDQLLHHAYKCLHNKDVAVLMATEFFKYDLGISADLAWPPKGCASILMEVAIRTEDDQRKIRLLAQAYNMDPGNQSLRSTNLKHLHQYLLSEHEAASTDMAERLFLKLSLEEKQEIPEDLIFRLTLGHHQLDDVSADQLLVLAQQIGPKRHMDGARLAARAALWLRSRDLAEAQDAFLLAFSLDRKNDDAIDGLIQSARDFNKKCKSLEEECQRLEKSCQDRSVISFVWDLSGHDFTGFRKGERQTSEKLPLSCWGINAWISLFPKGEEGSLHGKASLHLDFENIAFVRGKVRGGNQADVDFALDRPGTWVRRNFMDTSEIFSSGAQITLQIYCLSNFQPGRDGVARGLMFTVLSENMRCSNVRVLPEAHQAGSAASSEHPLPLC